MNDTKYYLTTSGTLTASLSSAGMFQFNKVQVDGTAYVYGWDLGYKFTNPDINWDNGGSIIHEGHIRNGDQNRNDWERQVFFMNNDGKYAVRSTNATGLSWGANTYWCVGEEPQADYSSDGAAFVWNLEKLPNELVHSKDWSVAETYGMWNGTVPEGGSLAVSDADDALKVVNPSALEQNYFFQYEVDNGITTVADEDYIVAITLKSTSAGSLTCLLGNWGNNVSKNFTVEEGDEWVTKEVMFSTFPYEIPNSNAAHILLQSGTLAGTILIQKVEVYRVPEMNPIAKPTRTATDAKTDVFANFKTIDNDATWDPDTRSFTKVCGWQWADAGIDLSQYRYIIITAGMNRNTDGVSGLPWDGGYVSIKDKNDVTVQKDEYGADYMNMWFSQWNNHNCLKIDLEKLRKEKFFDIYHITELKINGDIGFILGNVYATNQKPNNDKYYGGEDNGDYKVENLPKDKFGTICLPFQAAVAGAYIYQITGKTENGITLSQYDGLLEAGKAYIYKSNEPLNKAETSNVYFYKATAATVEAPVENNGLIGTFEATQAPKSTDTEDYLVLSGNKLYKVNSYVNLGQYRAYIKKSAITNSSTATSRSFNLSFDEATGIKTVDSQQSTVDNFYNLKGQRVSAPTKGLYIVNGKKVVIK